MCSLALQTLIFFQLRFWDLVQRCLDYTIIRPPSFIPDVWKRPSQRDRMTTIPPKLKYFIQSLTAPKDPELETRLKVKRWEVWTSSSLFSTCDFWAMLLLEKDWERGSTTFSLCPKINPQSYYQEKEGGKKCFCLAFCCSGHKQQSGIEGVWVHSVSSPPGFLPVNILSAVLAQDILASVRRRHGFRCSGLPHCSPWLTHWSWPFKPGKSRLIHAWDIWTQDSPWLSG